MSGLPDKHDLAKIAERLRRDEPAFATSRDFGDYVRQGAGHGPSVLIGDQSVIELYSDLPGSMLDYRMTLLAKPGDIAIVRQRSRAFEAYLKSHFGARCPTIVEAETNDFAPVARQCRTVARLRGILTDRLKEAGGMTLQSYMTTGHDWRLAQALGEDAKLPVYVHGAAPRIGRRVNDKLWFWRLAREIVGIEGVPPSFHAYGPAAAAAQVARIRALGQDAIIKVPSSAGGTGNLRLTQAVLDGLGLEQIRAMIVGRLRATGWAGHYPVLVGVWESGIAQSPSAQVFIPLSNVGAPIVKALFEQRVTGAEGEFVGAVPAILPPRIHDKMCQEARALATVLQALGYFGWCSFDAILRDDGTLHWIECNGRWSGVSIPLMTATEMVGHAPQGIAIAQDHIERSALPFDALVDRLGDLLLRADAPGDGLILTSPQNPAATALSFNAFAIADSQSSAETILDRARDRFR